MWVMCVCVYFFPSFCSYPFFHVPRCFSFDLGEVNEAEELCFFPVDNRRRGRQSVDALRAKVDETASDARPMVSVVRRAFFHRRKIFLRHSIDHLDCRCVALLSWGYLHERVSIQAPSALLAKISETWSYQLCVRNWPQVAFGGSFIVLSNQWMRMKTWNTCKHDWSVDKPWHTISILWQDAWPVRHASFRISEQVLNNSTLEAR